MRPLPLLLLLVLPLSGCGEKEPEWGGIGFTMTSEYEGTFYYDVWTNEYPESGDSGSHGASDNRSGSAPYFVLNTVYYCANGNRDYIYNGNHLDTVWLKVVVHELQETPHGPRLGEKWEEKRWEGLDCFEAYLVVFDENRELQLYHCWPCQDPDDRRGLTPLPATPTMLGS